MIHKLKPFSEPSSQLSFNTEVSISQKSSALNLAIKYQLSGATKVLNEITLLSESTSNKKRTQELWKNTCFEWFVKSKNSSKYWEFNASPTGEWNFYELDSYRSNLKESFLISDPSFYSELTHNSGEAQNNLNSTYSFSFEGILSPLLINSQMKMDDFFLAITSVINWKS